MITELFLYNYKSLGRSDCWPFDNRLQEGRMAPSENDIPNHEEEPDVPDHSVELTYLIAEYKSVCAEMNRRHAERYKFHALSLLMFGAIVTFFGLPASILIPGIKLLVLAIVPTPYLVIIVLMFKEHQYINMRDRYLDVVLRPAAEQLSGHRFSWWGWQRFERNQMGRHHELPRSMRRQFVFVWLIDPFDYAIPGLIAIASICAYYNLSGKILPPIDRYPFVWLSDRLWYGNIVLCSIVFPLIAWLRFIEQRWYPEPPPLPTPRVPKRSGL